MRELDYWLVILAEICGRTDRETETGDCKHIGNTLDIYVLDCIRTYYSICILQHCKILQIYIVPGQKYLRLRRLPKLPLPVHLGNFCATLSHGHTHLARTPNGESAKHRNHVCVSDLVSVITCVGKCGILWMHMDVYGISILYQYMV